jgi:hypothetical protein
MANAAQTTTSGRHAPPHAGVVGFFSNPQALLLAMEKVRGANYQSFDAFTPYPVHGLEAAQGLKRSPIPYVTFLAGLTGGTLGFLFQYWTSAIDWPINVGGKPFNSWPAFIPITFELTVLIGALCTVGAMFLLNGLPNTRRRAIDPRVTADRFAIVIEAPPELLAEDLDDPDVQAKLAKFKKYDESEAKSFLNSIGATEVRSYYAEGWF